MKIYETVGFQPYLTEEMILEGFLDSIKQSIGNKVDQAVTTVSNTVSALQVLYKIGTSPQFLDTTVTLMKKQIRATIKNLQSGEMVKKFTDLMTRLIPSGQNITDFLKLCLIAAATTFVKTLVEKFSSLAKTGSEAAVTVKDQAVDAIKTMLSQFSGLDGMVSGLTQASGIFTVLDNLGIANKLLFELLDTINKKIGSIKIGAGAI